MRFRVGCELTYDVAEPSTFLLNVHPARLERQRVLDERLTLDPPAACAEYVMPESGNRYVRFTAPPGPLRVALDATVELAPMRGDPAAIPATPVETLPFEVLPHLHPSRYCQADRLPRLAEQEFGALPAGHGQVTAVCNWIYERVAYVRGSTDVHTSAGDTLVERAGVCRDFAHLGIALCRAMAIPARFVSAYAFRLEPPDFHAVFEAWLDGRWWLFDPTRQAALDGLVRIGVGRDAAEVAFATIHGAAEPTGMVVTMTPVDLEPEDQRTTEAISVT